MAQPDVDLRGPSEVPIAALEEHLRDRIPGGLAGPLTATLLPGGRSNPTYSLADGQSEWILRRPPYGMRWQSAHDVGREVRMLEALHGTAVPVPEVIDHCEDENVIGAPFYVMPRIDGHTLRTREDTAPLAPEQRLGLAHNLIDTLVALHEVEPAAVGLENLGRPSGYLERQLSRWEGQWDKVRTADRDDASLVQRALAESKPESQLPGIVHGDYKLDNVLVGVADPTKILAVLDWEMATLGDTLADVGFLLSFWDEIGGLHNPLTAGATAWEGFPSVNDLAERYSKARGIRLEDLGWYMAFSNYKLAVILQQIHFRHLRGETRGEGFEDLGPMIDPLLALAHDRLKEIR